MNSQIKAPCCPFISSTFRDFQEERDYLVKHIFPELQQICKDKCKFIFKSFIYGNLKIMPITSFDILDLKSCNIKGNLLHSLFFLILIIPLSGTYFAPIDLRWGINKNQSQAGRVISLCLDYIQNGAPYFICLLGKHKSCFPILIAILLTWI